MRYDTYTHPQSTFSIECYHPSPSTAVYRLLPPPTAVYCRLPGVVTHRDVLHAYAILALWIIMHHQCRAATSWGSSCEWGG